MFLPFIQKSLGALSSVLFKKTMMIGDVPVMMFFLVAETIWLIIATFLFYFYGELHLLDIKMLAFYILLAAIIVVIWRYIITAKCSIVKEERLSDLIIYNNLHVVIAMIAWAFLGKDISRISLIIWVVAFVVLTLSQVDFNDVKIPAKKNLAKILFVQLFTAIQLLLVGYIMLNLNKFDYFFISEFLWVVAFAYYIIRHREERVFKKSKHKKFWSMKITQVISSQAWAIMYLFLLVKFGLSISLIFSLLWWFIQMIFGRILLKEIPTKWEFIMHVFIWWLVALAVYLQ